MAEPMLRKTPYGRGIVVGTIVGAVVVFVAYAMLARFVLHGEVNAQSLSSSVASAAGSSGRLGRPCQRGEQDAVWVCQVYDSEASGTARYRVMVRPGSSCWDDVLVLDWSEDGMPRSVSGCVHRWQWSLLS
jgi:hypothetical protein